jgi:hypothetical protein
MQNSKIYTISRPLPSEVAKLYEGIERDRAGMSYPPESLQALVEGWGTSVLLFTGYVDARVAALFAISHPYWSQEGSLHTGWITLYVEPEYRGYDAYMLGALGLEKMQGWGARALYTACLRSNRAAQMYATRLGFKMYMQTDALISYRLDM